METKNYESPKVEAIEVELERGILNPSDQAGFIDPTDEDNE